MFRSANSERCEREEYLERELDSYRQAEDERLEKDRRERERHRAERREESEQAQRTAETWPEAFRKQIRLLENELNSTAADDDDGDFWQQQIAMTKKAAELYAHYEKRHRDEIKELKQQIENVWLLIQDETADSLEEELPGSPELVELLRTGEPSDLLHW